MPTPHVQHRAPHRWPSTTVPLVSDPENQALAQQTVLLQDLPIATQDALRGYLDGTDEILDWSLQDIVDLHWRLLLELRRLPDPETPLEEKFDTLSWALTDPELDDQPFSFAWCLKVVGMSPLSPTAYFGKLDIDDIRDWLRSNARKWIAATLARYPDWVQVLVRKHPEWVARQLAKNPQWINEQVKRRAAAQQPDLFGDALPVALN